MSPAQYQLMIRLSKAKELLCETTLRIWEIAERVGNLPTIFLTSLRPKLVWPLASTAKHPGYRK